MITRHGKPSKHARLAFSTASASADAFRLTAFALAINTTDASTGIIGATTCRAATIGCCSIGLPGTPFSFVTGVHDKSIRRIEFEIRMLEWAVLNKIDRSASC